MVNNMNIERSQIAGRDINGSVNANESEVSNESKILRKARNQSFWISLLVGVVSSLIASFLFHLLINR